jgi:PAS domain S-box-containing protein
MEILNTELKTKNELLAENNELRLQLKDAHSIISAIRYGEIDALLISEEKGEQVYILQGADRVYREIIEKMNEGYVTLNEHGVILFCNKSFSQMLHKPLEQVIGTTMLEFFSPSEAETFGQYLASMSRFQREFVLKDANGLPVSALISADFCADGQLFAYIIVTDLTELKKAQTKLVELNAELEERVLERTRQLEEANLRIEATSSAKSAFLANMSHELRTPLNAIIGFSEVLQDRLLGPMNQKQEQYVSNILNSGKHLLSLINDVLDLCKVEASKMELNFAPVNLAELCQSTMTIFQEKAQQNEIALKCDTAAAMDRKMLVDERKIKQILFNLVDNGIKFNRQGGSVSVRLDQANVSAGKYWRIVVEDTGIGIAAGDIPKLFQPFNRLESMYKKNYPGTGLGLALTKQLVELHGGEIRLESEMNKGSRFIVLIPLQENEHE